jgi:hypothetical protein
VSSTEAFQRTTMPALQVELPTASMTTNNPDPAMGEECWKTDLDTTIGGGRQKPGLCGGQKPTRGDDDHVEGPPATGDPPHDIMGVLLL